jgi:lysophospholipase L1-like esterase
MSLVHRLALGSAVFAGALLVTACGASNGNRVMPATLQGSSEALSMNGTAPQSSAFRAPRGPLEYIAVGDSLTLGIGSTGCSLSACPSPVEWLSTSRANILDNGYVQTFAVQLATQRAPAPLQLDILAQSGELAQQLPSLLTNPPNQSSFSQLAAAAHARGANVLVVLNLGSNEILSSLFGTPGSLGQPFIGAGGDVRQGRLYQAYLAGLQSISNASTRGTSNEVIAVGIADISRISPLAAAAPAVRAWVRSEALLTDTAIQDALADAKLPHSAFLDLYGYLSVNPQYYGSGYFSSDMVHPNDQGYAILKQQVSSLYSTSQGNAPSAGPLSIYTGSQGWTVISPGSNEEIPAPIVTNPSGFWAAPTSDLAGAWIADTADAGSAERPVGMYRYFYRFDLPSNARTGKATGNFKVYADNCLRAVILNGVEVNPHGNQGFQKCVSINAAASSDFEGSPVPVTVSASLQRTANVLEIDVYNNSLWFGNVGSPTGLDFSGSINLGR